MSDPLVISSQISDLPNNVVGSSITLNTPSSNNALVPELTNALLEALEDAVASGSKVVLLNAAGPHFSTGGDIRRFSAEIARQNGKDFAFKLVDQLQTIVLKFLAMDAIVITAAQGAITGGSAGFVFASDLVVFDKSSFIQPYYREVGFAPDGGWSALLPEIIGPRNAASFQISNRRIEAKEAIDLGIGQHIAPLGKTQEKARLLAFEMCHLPNIDALIAAKRLIWSSDRLAMIERGLEAETYAFLTLFDTPHMSSTLSTFRPNRAS